MSSTGAAAVVLGVSYDLEKKKKKSKPETNTTRLNPKRGIIIAVRHAVFDDLTHLDLESLREKE